VACCKKVYTLPTFNLSVQIYAGTMFGAPGALLSTTIGQLQYGDLVANQNSPATMNFNFGKLSYLLLPAGTNIYTVICGPLFFNCFVQLPSNSGRWYQVMHVDDRWKGFTTEHRCALIMQSVGPAGVGWPNPIP